MKRPKPPITGIPAERKRCLMCGKPLGYQTTDTTTRVPSGERIEAESYGETLTGHVKGFRTVITGRVFSGWNEYGEGFHSLRCALKFADAAYRAGFRKVTTGGT